MKYYLLFIMLLSANVQAGWWEAESYEECVLDKMESQETKAAISEARGYCRNQFPLPPVDCSKYQPKPKRVVKKGVIQLNPYAFGILPGEQQYTGYYIPANEIYVPEQCKVQNLTLM